jgi:predicted alpha/beta-hydrolase family hydrolase
MPNPGTWLSSEARTSRLVRSVSKLIDMVDPTDPRRKSRSSGELAQPAAGALLLTPGAGADRNQRTLLAIEKAVAPLPCSRVDFPYRLRGSRAPDRAPVAVAHLRLEAEQLVAASGIEPDRLVLGGRSYGGRMCSMAVAEGLPAAGLILLSYPLHPPGKPANLRVEHFGLLQVPVLMISGKNDPFGSPAEFSEHVAAIPGPVTTVWLNGGHAPTGGDSPITKAVLTWLAGL